MIRSYSTTTGLITTVLTFVWFNLVISSTHAQQLQRIVNQTTVATSVTGSVNQFLVSDYYYSGSKDILTGGSTGVRLYPNSGFGTFGTAKVIAGGKIECMCDGDFNGDGLADFVYALDDSSAALRVALQNAAVPGTFDIDTIISAASLVLPTSGRTLLRTIGRSVKVADMDGDGYYDIIVTVNGAGADAREGALVYLRNTGDGINYETNIIAEDLGGIALLKLADLDGDGRVDIVVLGVDSRQVAVYYNEPPTIGGGGGNFTKLVLDETAESNLCIAIGDFNNYGNPDILAIGPTTIHFYLNNFGRNFQKWDMFDYVSEEDASTDYHQFSCALYDIDGNGLTDIVYTQGLQDGVFFLPQTQAEPSTFSGPGRLAAPAPQTSNFLLHDMDGDGIKDIISYSQGDQAVYAFLVEQLDQYESCMI